MNIKSIDNPPVLPEVIILKYFPSGFIINIVTNTNDNILSAKETGLISKIGFNKLFSSINLGFDTLWKMKKIKIKKISDRPWQKYSVVYNKIIPKGTHLEKGGKYAERS